MWRLVLHLFQPSLAVFYLAAKMQTIYRNLGILLLCCVLYSCKSLQRLSARDTSVQSSQAAKKKKRTDLRFIDDISISGGSNSRQIQEPSGSRASRKRKQSPQVVYAPPTDVVLTNYNIENASWLQFKYSILLDATVERLTNVLLLQNMDHWWGTHYCLGGATEKCIDCSAFTQIIMRDVFGTDVPRTARAQYDNSERIKLENLKEGDLIFFQTTGRDISHVGIYLTNNKFVHAATSNGVMVSDLNDSYWQRCYKGAGRVAKRDQMFSSVK